MLIDHRVGPWLRRVITLLMNACFILHAIDFVSVKPCPRPCFRTVFFDRKSAGGDENSDLMGRDFNRQFHDYYTV